MNHGARGAHPVARRPLDPELLPMPDNKTFYETVLPSGRAVRLDPLTTRKSLEIERTVAAIKGDGVTGAIQQAASVLKAYTPTPVALKFVRREAVKDGQKVLEDTDVVDLDATLEAVPAGAWKPTVYADLVTEGPGHVLEVFSQVPDWNALEQAIRRSAGYGSVNESLLGGKVRAVSASS